MRQTIQDFHLLRPWWLLLLLAALAVLWTDRALRREAGGWRNVVSPPLLPWLLVTSGRAPWFRPAPSAAALLALAALALSGPSWRREPSPFVADEAPLIVLLDVSKAAEPLLGAAKRKVRDLVAARGAARTGLIAYAGTAHLVLPPASDPRLIETYLDALSPAVMPRDGRDAPAALAAGLKQLDASEGAGTIVLVTNMVPAAQSEAFARAMAGSRHVAVVLAPGPPSSAALAGARGADVIAPTPDQADVDQVMQAAQRHYVAAGADDPALRWEDEGAWFALPLLPLALLWSRRGFLAVLLIVAAGTMPAHAGEPGWLQRLFLTPDQQGRLAFEHGDYATGAGLFADPMWRGVAFYRAGDFPGAVAAFAALDTPEAWFDRGNAQLMQAFGWNDALVSYDRALALRPEFPEARANRALAAAFAAQERALARERADQASEQPTAPPDDTVVDQGPASAASQKQLPTGSGEGLSDDQVTQLWMRRVGGSPADFLRARFARQLEATPR